MKRKNLISIRAAGILAALFLGSTVAATPATKTETYKDIIEKSYQLSLQKERSQAVLVLVNAIKKEQKKNPKAAKELIKALDQVSSVFYSDKSQQLYELGISMKHSDSGLAMSKVTEALKIEPDNQSILLAQLKLMILSGDCSAALSLAKKTKELNPFSEEIDLALAQSAVCAGQFEVYQQAKNFSDEKKTALSVHWTSAEIEYQYRAGNFSKAHELAKALSKLDPQYPESHYWQWKTEVELNEKAENAANKYVNLCKGLSTRTQRLYFNEPLLCRRTADVETFLKKNNNPSL